MSEMHIRNVKSCSRCGLDHDEVTAKQMERPFAPREANGVAWTHWFPCPTNGDPVLVGITNGDTDVAVTTMNGEGT